MSSPPPSQFANLQVTDSIEGPDGMAGMGLYAQPGPNSLGSAQPQVSNGTSFAQTVAKVITALGPTSLFGTGSGSQTFIADTIAVGTVLRITQHGQVVLPAGAVPTITFTINWGITQIATVATPALTAGITYDYYIDLILNFSAIGVSGSVTCTGGVRIYNDTTGLLVAYNSLTAANITIPTNANEILDITATFSSIANTPVINSYNGLIEVVA